MRSILVHTGLDAEHAPQLDSALDLARSCDAHLTVHINLPLAAFVAMDPFGGAHVMGEPMQQAIAQREDSVKALEARLAAEDVPWSIETSDAEPTDALVAASRLQDLVVMSLGDQASVLSARPPVGAVALAARCPVLALPQGRRFNPLGVAMVAWNGSHEAAHALRAAVPLLRSASAVHVVQVADPGGGRDKMMPAVDALSYLSRHGVHATAREETREVETVEEVLQRTAAGLDASLVVMGAYGHSRLRELLFGGVTRFALDTSERALLLAH